MIIGNICLICEKELNLIINEVFIKWMNYSYKECYLCQIKFLINELGVCKGNLCCAGCAESDCLEFIREGILNKWQSIHKMGWILCKQCLYSDKPGKDITTTKSESNDEINSPPHYKEGGIETLDFIKAKLSNEEFQGFLKANIIKYMSRATLKGGINDYKKAQFYLNKLVEILDVKKD